MDRKTLTGGNRMFQDCEPSRREESWLGVRGDGNELGWTVESSGANREK